MKQLSHLDGVLNGHDFFLLNLLGHADHARRTALLRQKFGKKLLKLGVNHEKYASTSFRVLLNDLHHSFNFGLQRTARQGCIEA